MSERDQAERVYRELCESGGSLQFGALSEKLLGNYPCNSLDSTLRAHPELFAIPTASATPSSWVLARSNLRMCDAYLNNEGCATGDRCSMLHLCRRYVRGQCKFRGRCKFSHDFFDTHNRVVLKAAEPGLEAQDMFVLQRILLMNNTFLLPEICRGYMYSTCVDTKCFRLHVCKYHVSGKCIQGAKCKHSHNILDEESKLYQQGFERRMIQALPQLLNDARNIRSCTVDGEGKLCDILSFVSHLLSHEESHNKNIICLFHLRKSCKNNERCPRMHYELPYRWQWQPWGSKWDDIPNMEEVEKEFCNPEFRPLPDHLYSCSNASCPVDFLNMTLGGHPVRRLSTDSTISKIGGILFATKWCWYWLDEYGKWIEYSSEVCRNSLSNKKQSDETLFFCTTLTFTAGSHSYLMDFSAIPSVDKLPNQASLIRHITDHHVIVKFSYQSLTFLGLIVKRVSVPQDSDEFKDVVAKFQITLPDCQVTKVERIQNLELWNIFKRMKMHNKGKMVEEKQLFHGTSPTHISAICLQNFDWRICGTNGTVYGKGSYFARDAKYSDAYAKDDVHASRFMFLVRVLVGEFTKGSSEYSRPPTKPGSSVHLYDSCVDDEGNPSIFVVFERDQMYPEYIMEYVSYSPLIGFNLRLCAGPLFLMLCMKQNSEYLTYKALSNH
uniref:Poly(ADP-ribose) polymerase family member 12 n=1 Tax=Eptatretus burgeri TaxID=7764 RepID=A0A8C4N8X8_EPTBU